MARRVTGDAAESAVTGIAVWTGEMHPRQADALVRIIRRWGELYWISYNGHLYHAERRDNGAQVHAGDAIQLERLIEEDYLAKPWPPGAPPVITGPTT